MCALLQTMIHAILLASCAICSLVFAILVVWKEDNGDTANTTTESKQLTPRPTYALRTHAYFPNSSQHPALMEFPATSTPHSVTEFQAVIFAGYGNALAPLTNDHGDASSPKALLPIANRPMISFPLAWLDAAGVLDVLLICPYSHRSAIAHYVHSDVSTFSSLKIDIQTYEDDEASSLGTASILRNFANRIKSDFVLLPCDFVPPPSLPLSVVLNNYRADSEAMIISTLFYEVQNNDDRHSPEDSVPQPPLIVYDRRTASLLHVDYNDDTEEDELELRMRMLWKYPNTRATRRFADSHVYVCRRSILTVLAAKPTLESIREDLLPFLCKVQYRKGKSFRWESILNQGTNHSTALQTHHSTSHSSPSWRSTTTSVASSGPASPLFPDMPKLLTFSLRCGIVIHTIQQGTAARVNNLKTYSDINRLFLGDDSPFLIPRTSASDHIDPKAQVSNDSIVGSSTRLGERSSIKKSVVGRHCIIGRNVRISGSVIMDHVVVEDGAKIDGCVLGRSTRVGSKAELLRSITQPGYEVHNGVILKNEKLDMADWDPHAVDDED